MLILLSIHALFACLAPILVRWMNRRAFLILALAPASAGVYALTLTSQVFNQDYPSTVSSWVPALGIELSFRVDVLSWLMLLIVGFIGAVVLVYCAAYFSSKATGLGKFGGVLTAFAGAMAGLVTADDMLVMFMFWELTTVFSYLLIGHYSERKAARRAAMQAIVVTTAGGLAMLVGIVLLAVNSTHGFSLSGLLQDPPQGRVVAVAAVCLFLGAASKSALIPMHFWLPAAMSAPTPVSSYLHAAAMVKAGVYLVARFAPVLATERIWLIMVLVFGGGTLLLGGYRALRQYDLKLVLAFGTVSQLGMIIMFVGMGTKSAALAGLAMLGAHALFKASLFLTVGVVDSVAGTRDLRRLSGLRKALPVPALTATLAVASMIGFMPFAGYVAKEAALEALVHDGAPNILPSWTGTAVTVVFVLGSVLTVAYGLRFLWGAFAVKQGLQTLVLPAFSADGSPVENTIVTEKDVKRPSWLLVIPGFTLALAGLVFGLLPALAEEFMPHHADSYPYGHPGHLTLWGGFGPPIFITIGILATGLFLFWQRNRVEKLQNRLPKVIEADVLYRRSMRKLDEIAADITAVIQRGSLPFYLGVILVVWTIILGGILISGFDVESKIRAWDTPVQAVVGVVIVAAVILATRARRRLKAVLLVGFTGYSVAFLFVLHGAPDLALTQVLVETVTLVVMVLVIRRLPPYFSDRPLSASRWVRLSIALGIGIAVMGIAYFAPLARIHEPVSNGFAEPAYEYGGGKNIVNVTLVDIRAWDTIGEISVLLVAATGVASLVFLHRRSGEVLRAQNVAQGQVVSGATWSGRPLPIPTAAMEKGKKLAAQFQAEGRATKTWLPAGRTLAPIRRSIIFEVVTRLVFHSTILFAIFLLFSGHNAPGGGFAAGLVVGIALVVRYLAGGRYELGEAVPLHPGLLLGSGLGIAATAAVAALPFGGQILQSAIIHFTLPLVGDVKLVTSLFFDIGVFLVVIGVVLDILRTHGAEIDRHIDAEAQHTPAVTPLAEAKKGVNA